MTTLPSYDWVREIKPDLKKLDSIPLTGASPPFPWNEFSARLAQSFDREGFNIQPGEISWRAKENLYEGLGDSPFPLIFSIPSLRGQVAWVMPLQEMSALAALLLTTNPHPLTLQDPALIESFYYFLALEVLYNLTQVSFDKTLSPVLTHQKNLPDQDSLCWDISLCVQNHTLWGRLIISPEFRSSWVEHFAQQQESSVLSQQMTQLVNVTLHLEAGKTQLSLAEWKSIQLGDFLILDSCSLDSERLEGRIILTINGKQAFRAKLKGETLKILELPLLHEVETSMVKQPDDDDDFSDLDLSDENHEEHDEEHDEEFEEEHDEEHDEEFEEDEDLFSEDDLFNEEETETEMETEMKTEASQIEEAGLEESFVSSTKATPSAETEKVSFVPEQIPVTLVVEVGQVQMTMEQLLKLEPGNLLEIDIHPKNGVDLTINGKVVGKGELIRIGEAIGVRILQLGR